MASMWFSSLFRRVAKHPRIVLYNTLGKAKQEFILPAHARTVRMYNCGPTVYNVQHIGNLSAFVFADILRRTLEYSGYTVRQVINITDFGHLTSDADQGEDKMMKGLKREGLKPTLENMKEMGRKYAELFKKDLVALNIDIEKVTFPFASDYIPAQIALIKTLEEKGYAYQTSSGVYFDTSRSPNYGELGDINLEGQRAGARVETDPEKRNPTDFILWKSDAKHGWDSPWGKGFPGWHIECSAMISSILGKQIDIHTGGIEHVAVHHNNEIAQSEAATGKRPFSRFWMHRAHIQLEGGKMAKSEGNVVYLSEVIKRGYHPLALRYLLLGAHYRTPANFTWDALDAAQTSFLRLRRIVDTEREGGNVSPAWQKTIRDRFNDDLDTPGALAAVWEMIKDAKISRSDVRATILEADKVFGLGLALPDLLAQTLCQKMFGVPVEAEDMPERVRTLLDAREAARKEKNWQHADAMRGELTKLGYSIEDTSSGPRVFKKD